MDRLEPDKADYKQWIGIKMSVYQHQTHLWTCATQLISFQWKVWTLQPWFFSSSPLFGPWTNFLTKHLSELSTFVERDALSTAPTIHPSPLHFCNIFVFIEFPPNQWKIKVLYLQIRKKRKIHQSNVIFSSVQIFTLEELAQPRNKNKRYISQICRFFHVYWPNLRRESKSLQKIYSSIID